jgi:hypothetical protein
MAKCSFRIALNPAALENPDLDLRYVLPDLLTQRSGGLIQDDGYDYGSDGRELSVFVKADNFDQAAQEIVNLIENTTVLGNDLRKAATVSLERGGVSEVIYPPSS